MSDSIDTKKGHYSIYHHNNNDDDDNDKVDYYEYSNVIKTREQMAEELTGIAIYKKEYTESVQKWCDKLLSTVHTVIIAFCDIRNLELKCDIKNLQIISCYVGYISCSDIKNIYLCNVFGLHKIDAPESVLYVKNMNIYGDCNVKKIKNW